MEIAQTERFLLFAVKMDRRVLTAARMDLTVPTAVRMDLCNRIAHNHHSQIVMIIGEISVDYH